MKKLAVFFPGIGYHCDKPLLYYGKKLAADQGYQIREVPYGGFEAGIKGDEEKMAKAFRSALDQAEKLLADINWRQYGKILFVSKSVGTAVAAAYGENRGLKTDNIFFTPVEQSFSFMGRNGIVFHGTGDPWASTEAIRQGCREKELPLFITEDANHSMETGEPLKDLRILLQIMETCKKYIESL